MSVQETLGTDGQEPRRRWYQERVDVLVKVDLPLTRKEHMCAVDGYCRAGLLWSGEFPVEKFIVFVCVCYIVLSHTTSGLSSWGQRGLRTRGSSHWKLLRMTEDCAPKSVRKALPCCLVPLPTASRAILDAGRPRVAILQCRLVVLACPARPVTRV